MFFASPLWLIALFPWAGAILWLLWGRRKRTPIPFLELWRGPALQKPAKRALQPPPIFLALAIVAMGLALLAAARPRLRVQRAGAGRAVTMIVDRGISMSAMSGGVPRFQIAARKAAEALAPLVWANTPVELLVLPGGDLLPTDAGDWVGTLKDLSPTAVDTQAILEESVRNRLATTTGPVVIVSDRQLAFDDPRLIQFSVDLPFDNVGIVRMAARETPVPQVMVRLRNDSDRRSVGLKVSSGSRVVPQDAQLPPRGQERDYFVDIDRLDATIEAALDIQDDQPADDRAWLLREGSSPRIEPRAPLSPPLRRIVEVFTRLHPPAENSQIVALVAEQSALPSQTPAALVASATGPPCKGTVTAAAGPITANINWQTFPAEVQTAGEYPKGWTPVVSIGDRVIVAARSEPVRQVWVGFDVSGWSGSSNFVVFWANVFTWAGSGQEQFASYPLGDFDAPWKPVEPPPVKPPPAAGQWPGIYQGPEGGLRAFDAPTAADDRRALTTADWRKRMEIADGGSAAQRGLDMAPFVLVMAIVCLAGAMITWRRPKAVLSASR